MKAAASSRGLAEIAGRIRSGDIKRVVVLTGAGVSVASGIPDFRSPGGMYDTLRPELLTATPQQRRSMAADPTRVVSMDLFSVNQFPYLEVRRPFILGTAERRWKMTLAHAFVELLHTKGLLQRLYTQNIDGLDFQTNIPAEKIVNVHGSLSAVSCEFCSASFPLDDFRALVRSHIKDIYGVDPEAPAESSNVLCRGCGKAGVKPSTVLYGNALPPEFFQSARADFPANTDLFIVAGTSLTVFPAASLVTKVAPGTPRLVINMDSVGTELGLTYSDADDKAGVKPGADVLVAGECDAGFLALACELGWLSDLMAAQLRVCDASARLLQEAGQAADDKTQGEAESAAAKT